MSDLATVSYFITGKGIDATVELEFEIDLAEVTLGDMNILIDDMIKIRNEMMK